ncbi:hypothetical protein Pen01_60770 [Phytomonospora endophytica]|nr:hypothetical protein Pen01_60770 [Phytomonospora endophytica]
MDGIRFREAGGRVMGDPSAALKAIHKTGAVHLATAAAGFGGASPPPKEIYA